MRRLSLNASPGLIRHIPSPEPPRPSLGWSYGITATGAREVLGLDVGDSEDEVFWRGFLAR